MNEYGWHNSHNIFSCEEIPYKSLYQICQAVCDPMLPNSENMMRLKKVMRKSELVPRLTKVICKAACAVIFHTRQYFFKFFIFFTQLPIYPNT